MTTAKAVFKAKPAPNETLRVESVPRLGEEDVALFERGTATEITIVWSQRPICVQLIYSAATGSPSDAEMVALARKLSRRP